MLRTRRGAEAVDRLRVVAHHREVRGVPARPHRLEDVGLQRVRVLVLVDQDVVEHRGDAAAPVAASAASAFQNSSRSS